MMEFNNPYECLCGFKPDDALTDTEPDEWHATYTIQLGELIESGVFTWEGVNWKDYAYDDEQYERFCAYFVERFYFREISMLPYLQWAMKLHNVLCYELMPKYEPMYKAGEQELNPYADKDEYGKDRDINSQYPETILSGNSDYITDGNDREYEHITLGNVADMQENYVAKFRSVDTAICDELEKLFIGMYTVYANGL